MFCCMRPPMVREEDEEDQEQQELELPMKASKAAASPEKSAAVYVEACKEDGSQQQPPEDTPSGTTPLSHLEKQLAAINAQNAATRAKLIALNESLGIPPPKFEGNSSSSSSDDEDEKPKSGWKRFKKAGNKALHSKGLSYGLKALNAGKTVANCILDPAYAVEKAADLAISGVEKAGTAVLDAAADGICKAVAPKAAAAADGDERAK